MKPLMRKLYRFRLILILGTLIIIFVATILRFLLPFFQFAQKNSLGVGFFYNLVTNQNILKKTNERTNILILGMAGGNHEGPDLTDTMLFLSLDLKNHQTYVISVPRDIWSETLKDKINSAYHYGQENKKNEGLILADTIVAEVLGQPVHYDFVVDFNLFKELIDLVGGVTVNVDNTFDDYKYPITGKENDLCDGDPEFKCRYEHLHFDEGMQKMNGEIALKFIRSRNAEGVEGSDFARGKRQQKILDALKEKMASKEITHNPSLLLKIWNIFEKNCQTNATLAEMVYLGREMMGEKSRNTVAIEDQLTNPPEYFYDGRWVLIPKTSWEGFHQFIKESLKL